MDTESNRRNKKFTFKRIPVLDESARANTYVKIERVSCSLI
jgi:hypothetical protein